MAAMWLVFAFSGPVLWAASMHIDKYFRRTLTAVLMVFNSVVGLLALPVIWCFVPVVFAVSPLAIAVMTASGALYVAAMLFYLQAIQSEEDSVVGPLFQGAVLCGALLAFLLLGETLSSFQMLGGAFIVAGALVLSVNSAQDFKSIRLRLLLTMLACTFSLALSSVIFKYFAVGGEFWVTTFWTYVGAVAAGEALLATGGRWKQF